MWAHPSPFLPPPPKASFRIQLCLHPDSLCLPSFPHPQHLLLYFCFACVCNWHYFAEKSTWSYMNTAPFSNSYWPTGLGEGDQPTLLTISFPILFLPCVLPNFHYWPHHAWYFRLKSNLFSISVYGLYFHTLESLPLPPQTLRNSFLCCSYFYEIPMSDIVATLSATFNHCPLHILFI